jgi:rod shape-determining protein MreC
MHSGKFPKRLTIVVVSIAIAIFLLDIGGVSSSVRGVLFSIGSPIASSVSAGSFFVSQSVRTALFASDIREMNESLFAQNRQLEARIAQLESARAENEELRSALELSQGKEYSLEWTRIIAYGEPTRGEWILIDKGDDFDIREGMPVVVDAAVLVGIVEEVYAQSAKVRLLTAGDFVANVRIADTRTRCLIRGSYGLGLRLDDVLPSDDISEGDRVITSELGLQFPSDLFVGTVRDIRTDEDGVSKSASVDPGISVYDRDMVAVMREAL